MLEVSQIGSRGVPFAKHVSGPNGVCFFVKHVCGPGRIMMATGLVIMMVAGMIIMIATGIMIMVVLRESWF